MLRGFNGVKEFNNVIGNLDNVDEKKLIAQARCVLEEAKELHYAVTNNEGSEQLLKETVDVIVTIFGVVQQLQTLGYNVWDALDKVNKNNLTKVSMDAIQAAYTQDAFAENNVDTVVVTTPHGYAVKDSNGKVRKPINYKAVSVAEFIPEEA